MRAVPKRAIDLIKSFESCELRAYHGAADPPDVWTIGWGHTGPEVHQGLVISQAHADRYLKQDVDEAARRLAKVVRPERLAKLTDGQYGALVSFVFNLGADPGWTIWKRVNAGDLDDVPAQMMRFVNSDGKRRPGLVRRRGAEVALWTSADLGPLPLSPIVPTPPSSVTRIVETPPTPEPPKPLASVGTAAKATQAGAGLTLATATQVQSAVEPHAADNRIFTAIYVLCGVIILAIALWQIWAGLKQKRERAA